MSYEIKCVDEIYTIQLFNEPKYCYGLRMSPEEREEILQSGNWLILVFAVWSAPDRECLNRALSIARKFEGKFNLGLRPFSDYKENEKWCPDLAENYSTPIWLCLKNGDVSKIFLGAIDSEQLEEYLSKSF